MRKLLEKKGEIVEEMRGLIASPTGDGGDLSPEQDARFDTLKGELAGMKKRISRQALLDEADRWAVGTPLNGTFDFEREARNFDLLKMIQYRLGVRIDAGREIEVSDELARREGRSSDGFFMPYSFFEKRAISTGLPATGPGGNLIGTDHLGNQFIDTLREANPLAQLGVRTLTGLQGNVEIPRLKQSASVGWFGENSEIPETDAEFDKITLTPKHVGAWAQYSRHMLLQSSPDLESILRSDLAQVLGMEVARATIAGTGAGAEPLGILNTTGIQRVTKPADSMGYVPELASALFLANVGNISFVANSGFKKTVDQLLTTDGLPVGAAAFFRNYPHVWTSMVPAGSIMLAGDFSDIIQGTWSAVEVLINPYMESAYKRGNVAIRIILTMDVAVRHPESFATFEA